MKDHIPWISTSTQPKHEVEYNGIVIDDSSTKFAQILEKIAYDDDWWKANQTSSKGIIAHWIYEHFKELSDKTRTQLLYRLVTDSGLVPEFILGVILGCYPEVDDTDVEKMLDLLAECSMTPASFQVKWLLRRSQSLPRPLADRVVAMVAADRLITDELRSCAISYDACITAPLIVSNRSIREWWHQILGRYDRYPSYAMLLALPSDNEATRYLKEYGKELHLISGKACLVITLSSLGFIQYGSDDDIMPLAVEEYVAEGYSLQVAELFQIKFDQFPCLLLFRDIRRPEHILISLKGLDAKGTAQEMRTLFSVVSQAVKQDKDPITAVEEYNKQQVFSEKKKATWSSVRSFVGKTLETIMEAFVKAGIK